MARPRKPTNLHIVSGTYRKDRHGDRVNEPEVAEPLGGPPECWTLELKMLWAEIADLIPAGVARKSDRVAFEMLLRLIARMRENYAALTPALAAQLRTALAVFGMTPADRSRVSVPRSPGPNPFAEIERKARKGRREDDD